MTTYEEAQAQVLSATTAEEEEVAAALAGQPLMFDSTAIQQSDEVWDEFADWAREEERMFRESFIQNCQNLT